MQYLCCKHLCDSLLCMEILIDHNSIVAFKDTVDYKLQMIGNCMMCCCGGDGMCGAKMTGPGEVYMQSMSFEKFVKSVAPSQAQ